MLGNGYTFEAQYIRVIRNWRRACDERGLSELQRCHYNYDLLNFLLDDLMPWHTECYDFSLLEVNRYVHMSSHIKYLPTECNILTIIVNYFALTGASMVFVASHENL